MGFDWVQSSLSNIIQPCSKKRSVGSVWISRWIDDARMILDQTWLVPLSYPTIFQHCWPNNVGQCTTGLNVFLEGLRAQTNPEIESSCKADTRQLTYDRTTLFLVLVNHLTDLHIFIFIVLQNLKHILCEEDAGNFLPFMLQTFSTKLQNNKHWIILLRVICNRDSCSALLTVYILSQWCGFVHQVQ